MSLKFGSNVKLRPPKSIVNFWSTTGAAASAAIAQKGKVTLSGALTATTYKELLAVTGPGVIDICGAYAVDVTERTIGLKVIIDGTTVFDAVTAACTTQYGGIYAIGHPVYFGEVNIIPQPMVFNSTLSVLVKSSLNETDKIGLHHSYHTV